MTRSKKQFFGVKIKVLTAQICQSVAPGSLPNGDVGYNAFGSVAVTAVLAAEQKFFCFRFQV